MLWFHSSSVPWFMFYFSWKHTKQLLGNDYLSNLAINCPNNCTRFRFVFNTRVHFEQKKVCSGSNKSTIISLWAAIIRIQGKHVSFLQFNILLLSFQLCWNTGMLTSFPPILNKVSEKRGGKVWEKGGGWRLYWLCWGWKLFLFFSVGLPCLSLYIQQCCLC